MDLTQLKSLSTTSPINRLTNLRREMQEQPNRDYFAKYIFPSLLIFVLAVVLVFMQGRVSSADVTRMQEAISAETMKMQTSIQANSESISKLTSDISRLVGYIEGQEQSRKSGTTN